MKYYFLLLGLLGLYACSNSSNSEEEKIKTVVADSIVLPPKDTIHRIKLTFVGDIMGHGPQISSAAGSKANLKSKDMANFNYEPCFRYISPILQQADMAIGNLELTLSNKGRYKGYPMFKSPDKIAYDLKAAGFDFLTTCNNHSNDAYTYGIHHTIDILDSLGFYYTGTFKDSAGRAERYPLIINKEVDGTVFRLAFINYTYGTNGVKTPAPAIVNLIEDSIIIKDIAKAKLANPDMIIAIMHWGNEYKLHEHKNEVRVTKLLWDNGVDVVIGGHPHVIEPIKMDTLYNADSSQQREVLVTYSLGNFISNQKQTNTDIGLVFELELVKNSKTNQTKIGKHNYIFAWRYIHDQHKGALASTYTVVPVTAFENNGDTLLGMSAKTLAKMNKVTNRMRKHLGQWKSKERKVSLAELGKLKPLKSKK